MCRNPLLADERARKRKEVADRPPRRNWTPWSRRCLASKRPLRGKDKIGLRIGRDLKSTKMQKHFELTIEDDSFSYRRLEEKIAAGSGAGRVVCGSHEPAEGDAVGGANGGGLQGPVAGGVGVSVDEVGGL